MKYCLDPFRPLILTRLSSIIIPRAWLHRAGQYGEATSDLHLATEFLKSAHAHQLDGYPGNNIHYIINALNRKRFSSSSSSPSSSSSAADDDVGDDTDVDPTSDRDVIVQRRVVSHVTTSYDAIRHRGTNDVTKRHLTPTDAGRRRRNSTRSDDSRRRDVIVRRRPRSAEQRRGTGSRSRTRPNVVGADENIEIVILEEGDDDEVDVADVDELVKDISYKTLSSLNESLPTEVSSVDEEEDEKYGGGYTYAHRLLKIAHLLHYVGIGILAFFVIQVGNRNQRH